MGKDERSDSLSTIKDSVRNYLKTVLLEVESDKGSLDWILFTTTFANTKIRLEK